MAHFSHSSPTLFPTRAQLSPPLLAQQIPRRPSPLQPERPRSAPLRSARSSPAPSLSPRNAPSPALSTCPAVSRSPSPNPAQTTTPAQPRASCLPDRMAPPVSFPSRPHGTAQHSTQLFPNRPSQATPRGPLPPARLPAQATAACTRLPPAARAPQVSAARSPPFPRGPLPTSAQLPSATSLRSALAQQHRSARPA